MSPDAPKRFLRRLARHAYRRPVTDADLDPLLAFYAEGRKAGGFDEGVERGLKRLLVGPEFLLRVEADPPDARPNTPHRINDVELASRLSFFLWNSIPDEELLTLAARKQLGNPATLTKQIRRMVADPRFGAFVEELRRAVALPAEPRRGGPGAAELSGLRRHAAPGVPPRNRALLREHRARGSQRARPVAGRLHVRERTAGQALRHSQRHGQPFPARQPRAGLEAQRVCSVKAAF